MLHTASSKRLLLSWLPVALLLGGCSGSVFSGDPQEEPTGATTALQVAISVQTDPTTRDAVTQTDDGGTANERTVSQMTVLLQSVSPISMSGTALKHPSESVIASDVIRIESSLAGERGIATLLNGGRLSAPEYDKDQVLRLEDGFGQFVSGDTPADFFDFLMTSTVDARDNHVTIDRDATKAQVLRGEKNVFSLNVERVLSKLQVRVAETPTMTGPMDSNDQEHGGLLFVDDLKYALAGSAREIYLYRDHATEQRKMDGTSQQYDGVTAIDKKTVDAGWEGHAPRHPFLQRVSDYIGQTGAEASNFAAKSVPTVGTDPGTTGDVIYFLENSTDQQISGRGQLLYNRIAYAKVYGIYIPKQRITYDATKNTFGITKVLHFNPRPYAFRIDPAYYDRLAAELGTTRDPSDNADMWVTRDATTGDCFLHAIDPMRTFYIGEDDRLVFDSLEAAIVAGNRTVTRYVEGKMVWLIPVNARLGISSTTGRPYVVNADTRRNNIYDIVVTGFSGLGLPYDPIDPRDPNIPERENPFAPTISSDIPVDPLTSKITIRARVLDWNYQRLDYTF